MIRIRTAAAAASVALAFSTLSQPVALAAPAGDEVPCAAQSAKVDKAQDALDRLTAVFAKKKEHVAKAKKNVEKADSRAERKAAKAKLATAKEKKDKVKKDKKAQQQRLAKAQERLAKCLAAQPEAPAAE